MITRQQGDIEDRGSRNLHVRIPADVHERLTRIAQDEQESIAVITRRALRRELHVPLIESR